MNHFTSVTDFNPEQIQNVLDNSNLLEQNKKDHALDLQTKNILFCFEKPSLRTLVGTESGLNQLGADVIHTTPEAFLGGNIIHSKEMDLGERESLKDTVKNVEQFCDAIFVRVFSHITIKKLSALSEIPVVNALCDIHHPCQALADLFTLQEHFGKEKKLEVVFMGDGNNVAFSLGQILLMLGHSFVWAGPKPYIFESEEIESLKSLEKKYGGELKLSHEVPKEIASADAIYTDAWVSMGEESEYQKKASVLTPFQVNAQVMRKTKDSAIFMHCLPAHRDEEVTNEVIDSQKSLVYQQAKNRMVTAKGLFHFLLNK